jgi:hypothetical protein
VHGVRHPAELEGDVELGGARERVQVARRVVRRAGHVCVDRVDHLPRELRQREPVVVDHRQLRRVRRARHGRGRERHALAVDEEAAHVEQRLPVLRDSGRGDVQLWLLQHGLVARQDLVDGQLPLVRVEGIVRRAGAAKPAFGSAHASNGVRQLGETHAVVMYSCDDAFAAKIRVSALPAAADELLSVWAHTAPALGPRLETPNGWPVWFSSAAMNTWSLTV